MAQADFDFTDEDDFDSLIDKAVDTFFVEAPTDEELAIQDLEEEKSVAPEPTPEKRPPDDKHRPEPPASGRSAHIAAPTRDRKADTPSLDEAVDSLFMSAFDDEPAEDESESVERTGRQVYVTSGDDETDREIDLAVDTLFVEVPDTPVPETTEIEVELVEEAARQVEAPKPVQLPPPPPPPPPQKTKPKVATAPAGASRSTPAHPVVPAAKPPQPPAATPGRPQPPKRPDPVPPRPPATAPPAQPDPKKAAVPKPEVSYDDIMAEEIRRHMDSLFQVEAGVAPARPKP
ncbi:MAG: hypothetical protein V2B18_02695, partial [Pseudomonadota bacterium]